MSRTRLSARVAALLTALVGLLAFHGCASGTEEYFEPQYTLGEEGRIEFFNASFCPIRGECRLEVVPLGWDEMMEYPFYASIRLHDSEAPVPADWTYESSDPAIFEVGGLTCGGLLGCPTPEYECVIEDPECTGERRIVNVALDPIATGKAYLVIRDGDGALVDRLEIEVEE